MRTETRVRLAGLGVFLAAACLPIDQVEFAELTVEVVDQHGDPVPGARVEAIGGWYWSSPRAIEETGPDGTVVFRLPPTFYKVDVYRPDSVAGRPFVYYEPFVLFDTLTVGGEHTLVYTFTRP